MKLFALLGAGLLATGTIAAAVPTDAAAQRHGWRNDHRGYYGHNRWNRAPRYRGGYGYRHGGYRGRVVCRVHRGYYGPVRRCVRR